MIEVLDGFPDNVVAVSCTGTVTGRDYEDVLVPEVERTLAQHEKVRLFYRIGEDFESIVPGAMWEDFKIGVAHLSRWERMAVVTDVDWIGHTVRAFGFLMPGEIRIFPTGDEESAREWIAAPGA